MGPVQAISTEQASLDKIVQALVAKLDPQRIILFGSWARGDQRPDSDFDIFVEVAAGADVREASRKSYEALHSIHAEIRRGVDIVVKDRAFVERYGDLVGTIVRPVMREGIVLYAR